MKGFKNRIAFRLPLAALVLIATLALNSGCTRKEAEIKIGIILPLTGEGAALGEDCRNGVVLAASQVENNTNRKFRWLYEDSRGEPGVAVSAFNKLRASGVKIVIGDLFSSPTLAIAPIAEKRRILVFSPGASNPKLSEFPRYIFRNYPSDDFEGMVIAKSMRDNGYDRVAVLYPNNAYGVGLKEVFISAFTDLGGTVLLSEGYEENQATFGDLLAKVSSSQARALYMPGYYRSIARIAVQAKELGIQIAMFSNIGVEHPELHVLARDAVEGLRYTAPAINLSAEDGQIWQFVEEYKRKFGQEPGFPAAYGYDAVQVLVSVILEHGENPDSISKGLKIGLFEGVTGPTKFDEKGDVVKPFVMKVVRNGSFQELEKVVM